MCVLSGPAVCVARQLAVTRSDSLVAGLLAAVGIEECTLLAWWRERCPWLRVRGRGMCCQCLRSLCSHAAGSDCSWQR
jgi:hypothetical protein